MEKQMTLTEARSKFSEIVNEVMYQGDTYVISKLDLFPINFCPTYAH